MSTIEVQPAMAKSAGSDLLLDVKDLRVTFSTPDGAVTAVNNLNFSLRAGETLGIVGESGSGKSQTAFALMGLLASNGHIEGSARFNGREILNLPEKQLNQLRAEQVAMIFQDPMTSLNPYLRVGDQLIEVLQLHKGMSKAQAFEEAVRMLDAVKMPEARKRMKMYPHEFSGGMRQRVMIAMALSCRPALLIADEPTTALDVTIQAQILQLIRVLQKEMEMGVIFITHDMGVVAEMADRVQVMYRGEVVESNDTAALFSAPQQPYTRALLAAVPRLGAMHGQPLPRKFPLPGEQESREMLPDTVRREEQPILQVRDLVTRFDIRAGLLNRVKWRVHAVEKVSFDLHAGETLALVGESGCGKSTTGRSLLRLVESQGGSITFNGQRIDRLRPHQLSHLRRDIQFIFQDPYASLDPRLTVGFSIMEPLLIHKVMSRAEAEKRVAWLLEKVGLLPEHARRYPHEFSGGQRQRICIARALALNTKVVIADESVSALDVSIQAQIVNLMLDLQREFGIAFLFISHDMAVVERISHRVAVMYLGQIVEIGPRPAVFENPQHPYTRKLMAAVPVADPGHRRRERALLVDELPSPLRAPGDEPAVAPLIKVGDGHYVARHTISGA